MDRSTMKLISEKKFIHEFGRAFNQAKEWDASFRIYNNSNTQKLLPKRKVISE